MIFFLLRLELCPHIQENALRVLNNVTGNAECIDDIAANSVIVNLFQPLYSSFMQPTVISGLGGHEYQPSLCLAILHSLMGDTRLVKECIHYSKLTIWAILDLTLGTTPHFLYLFRKIEEYTSYEYIFILSLQMELFAFCISSVVKKMKMFAKLQQKYCARCLLTNSLGRKLG